MAIEPIGSMTAIQVQSTVKPADASNNLAAKRESDSEAMAETTATPKMDDNTSIVAKSSESNTKQQDNNTESQAKTNTEAIKKAVEEINKKMKNSEAVFGIHDGTNRVTIKIVDKKSKEIIKELPPEKTLDMIAKVWEMAGLLVDEKR